MPPLSIEVAADFGLRSPRGLVGSVVAGAGLLLADSLLFRCPFDLGSLNQLKRVREEDEELRECCVLIGMVNYQCNERGGDMRFVESLG